MIVDASLPRPVGEEVEAHVSNRSHADLLRATGPRPLQQTEWDALARIFDPTFKPPDPTIKQWTALSPDEVISLGTQHLFSITSRDSLRAAERRIAQDITSAEYGDKAAISKAERRHIERTKRLCDELEQALTSCDLSPDPKCTGLDLPPNHSLVMLLDKRMGRKLSSFLTELGHIRRELIGIDDRKPGRKENKAATEFAKALVRFAHANDLAIRLPQTGEASIRGQVKKTAFLEFADSYRRLWGKRVLEFLQKPSSNVRRQVLSLGLASPEAWHATLIRARLSVRQIDRNTTSNTASLLPLTSLR